MLEIKGLHFRHSPMVEDTIKGIEFRADTGEVTTILGPNGCGKTTIFKCMAGVWKPQRGKVFFDGVGGAPKEPKAAELAPCDLGVGQKYPLPPFFQRADFSIAA